MIIALLFNWVCSGLPAHAADVRINDVIIELEGIDVRHASGKQIVSIIRYSTELMKYNITHTTDQEVPHYTKHDIAKMWKQFQSEPITEQWKCP